MYLLYVDESGSTSDPNQLYFVLAGVSMFETDSHWIEQRLNKIVSQLGSSTPHEIELHGSPMHTGAGRWRKVNTDVRRSMIKEALQVAVADYHRSRIFAAVVENGAFEVSDPIRHCFEQLAMRFDLFLQRRHTKYQDTQRGLMLFDEAATEQRIQTLAREFKYSGHNFGMTRNYADVPVFMDSRASRLIQLADLVAFAIYRHFAAGDSQYFDIIKHKFDAEGSNQYGLVVRNKPKQVVVTDDTLNSLQKHFSGN